MTPPWPPVHVKLPAMTGPVKSLAAVGLMSYSLYLTHSFVLMHWYWFGFTRLHILTVSLLIMTPLSVAFAWVFFRVCERPFMTSSAVRAASKSRNASTEVSWATD